MGIVVLDNVFSFFKQNQKWDVGAWGKKIMPFKILNQKSKMKYFPIFVLLNLILLYSCTEQTNKANNTPITIEKKELATPSLKATLDAKKAAFEKKASKEKKRIYAEGIDAVVASGIIKTAKQLGDTAPDFSLKNATEQTVQLSDYLEKGPVVLTWYRGSWCPYCNMTLARLQKELPNFKAAGASLIALTPELPDSSFSTKEKQELEFEVLSDIGNKVAKEYGIVFELTPEVAAAYQKGFDLHGYNGDETNELPLAATYIIDKNGVIQYAFLDADYRKRAEPFDVLVALKKMME